MEITFIGHLCVDFIVLGGQTRFACGGGVFFGGIAAARLGARVKLYTKCAPADRERFTELDAAGVEVILLPSQTSTSMEDSFPTDHPDDRQSRVLSYAAPFTADDLRLIDADVLHISPLCRGEFPSELIPLARARARTLGLDVQGFLRFVDDGEMVHQDWPEKRDYLRHVDLLKVDNREARVLTGETEIRPAVERLGAFGAKTVMLTHAEGVSVYDGDRLYESAFAPYSLDGRTGRGDTCTAAYLVARANEPQAAATRIAAEVTSKKMQYPGPYRG